MQNVLTIDFEVNNENQNIGLSTLELKNLVKNHHLQLVKFINRKVKNFELAEDIAQYTYIEAIKSSHNFKGNSTSKTWLFGIAVNLTKNPKNYQKINDQHFFEVENITITETPEDELSKKQMLLDFGKNIAKMPIKIQKTAYLVICKHLSYEKSAQILNIPIGTVRSRIYRARKILKITALEI